MSTYFDISGGRVNYVSSDPSDPQTGQVWYNYTSAVLKVRAVSTSGTWASGGNCNNTSTNMGGTGIQTAALKVGGEGSPVTFPTSTEEYDGTSWTSGGAYPQGIIGSGLIGTQTAAVNAGGVANTGPPAFNIATTKTYNGTSWTANPANLNQARSQVSAFGSDTAGIIAGGDTRTPGGFYSNSEKWNGTSWTATPALNTARGYFSGAGTDTSAVVFGGSQNPYPTVTSATEEYNGTSWTSVTGMTTGRQFIGGSPAGTQNSAIAFAGQTIGGTSVSTATEEYNGTSWSAGGNCSQGVSGCAGMGTASAGLKASGYNNPVLTAVNSSEEYTGPGVAQTKTVTVS